VVNWLNAAPRSTAVSGVVRKPATADTPAPTAKNTNTPNDQSVRFFITTLPAFLARTCPASNNAKPGCMKKIRNDTTNTQTASTPPLIASACNNRSNISDHPRVHLVR
jgi:hypothetical protein